MKAISNCFCTSQIISYTDGEHANDTADMEGKLAISRKITGMFTLSLSNLISRKLSQSYTGKSIYYVHMLINCNNICNGKRLKTNPSAESELSRL